MKNAAGRLEHVLVIGTSPNTGGGFLGPGDGGGSTNPTAHLFGGGRAGGGAGAAAPCDSHCQQEMEKFRKKQKKKKRDEDLEKLRKSQTKEACDLEATHTLAKCNSLAAAGNELMVTSCSRVSAGLNGQANLFGGNASVGGNVGIDGAQCRAERSAALLVEQTACAENHAAVVVHFPIILFAKLTIIKFGHFMMVLPRFHHNYSPFSQIKI